MKSESRSYRIPEGVFYQELDKESVLLNLATEQYYSLDPVGTRIWQLLAKTESIAATVAIMVTEYGIDDSILQRDVEELVRKLIAKGLLAELAGAANGTGS